MNGRWIYVLLIGLVSNSCSKNGITLPPYNANSNLSNTILVTDSVIRQLEGVYMLGPGSDGLGSHFVCKKSKSKLSFFSAKEGIYIILNYGLNPNDSSIQFSGFWRYSERRDQGTILFSISVNNGARDLLLQHGVGNHLILEGAYTANGGSTAPLSFIFERQFSAYTLAHPFQIYAHHGVQTTANPPYAENSLGGVLHDEDYGANGLEFDVHLTRDHVPICIHDGSINTRINEKGPLSGDFIQYDFPFLTRYIRLVDGEQIPSVEQVLTAFIDSTSMTHMWLDIKGDPGIFKYLEPVVRNAYSHAAAVNRTVVIFADLPTKSVIKEYQTQPSYASLPTMCELSLQDVMDNHCQYYGPRFSEGLLLAEVEKAHSLGIQVLSWTLNDKNIISNYIQNGKFDGVISDYPAYVVYDYYTYY